MKTTRVLPGGGGRKIFVGYGPGDDVGFSPGSERLDALPGPTPSAAGIYPRGACALPDKLRTLGMILVLDNYDSFTWNLVQFLGALGADPVVVRNDRASVREIADMGPSRIVVSPGPCTPREEIGRAHV